MMSSFSSVMPLWGIDDPRDTADHRAMQMTSISMKLVLASERCCCLGGEKCGLGADRKMTLGKSTNDKEQQMPGGKN